MKTLLLVTAILLAGSALLADAAATLQTGHAPTAPPNHAAGR